MKNDKEFEAYFQKRLNEDRNLIKNLSISIEELKEIYWQEFEFKEKRPVLKLKMEPQKLNHEIVASYLPEKWEMPREGKLLYSDEELMDVLTLIVYNLGVEKALSSIPKPLIKRYLKGENL
ncbi:hypothetical protein [Bacillus andreraoultii]|uniref:hypothetical protein n=1 Tax=Bacillus andreraoultii TaxID=1499685 RepID=UPI00053B40BA|nr:hypothetical protein [Bacillus andreraoultii]